MSVVMPDACYAAIADFDAVKPDRVGMYDLRDDGAHYAGMGDDQAMLALMVCDHFMVSRADAMNEVVERFRILRPVMYRIVQKAPVFVGVVDFDFIVAQTFPDAETDFLEPRFDTDADPMFLAERDGECMATLQRG